MKKNKYFEIDHQNQQYVLKKVLVNDLTQAQEYANQAKQLRALRHRNVIQYIDDFIHADYSGVDPIYHFMIVMEYCEGGDLCDLIEKSRDEGKTLSNQEFCQALRYTHSHNIIHRDIKSQNIFLTKKGLVKLGDFGLSQGARKIKSKEKAANENDYQESSDDSVGTECYMSPQILRGQGMHGKGKSSDIWAAGCVLLEMLTGKFTWQYEYNLGEQAPKNGRLIESILSQNKLIKKLYDRSLLSLLKRMLFAEPEKRPSIQEICKKKFMRSYNQIYYRKKSN